MAEVPYHSNNPAKEAPANSETAVDQPTATLVPEASRAEVPQPSGGQSSSMSNSQPGSAEAAAEKLFEERMEDEYAKREGGA
nr:hypothetical protein CFP56_00690 [Quercus suber]